MNTRRYAIAPRLQRVARAFVRAQRPRQPGVAVLILGTFLVLAACRSPDASPTPTLPPTATARPAVTRTSTSTSTSLVPATHTATPTVPAPDLTPGATPVPAPASILSFEISPPQVSPGEPVTLSWSALAERVFIHKLDYKGRLLEPAFSVPLSGTLVITAYQQQGNRTGFFLSACVGDVCDHGTVSAEVRCTRTWFFANPPEGCPGAPSYTTVLAQHFQHGLMLWLEAADWRVMDEIVLFYDDDAGAGRRWEMTVDTWEAGMPEEDPDLVPPAGYYEPVRGFGKVWRESPGVRQRLGWATEEEFRVGDGAFQCATGGYGRCYVSGPNEAVYVLEPEMSGWFIWPGPAATPGTLPTPTGTAISQIAFFTADPSPADPAGTVTLSWHARGAAGVSVQWLDKNLDTIEHPRLPLSGSLSVALTEVKFTDGDKVRFFIFATDADGRLIVDENGRTVSEIIDVPLKTDLVIASFSGSPDPVERGGTVVLSWKAPHAASTGITLLSPEGIFLRTEAFNLPAEGSFAVEVPEEYTSSITFYLGAVDTNGVTRGAYVTVGIICPFDSYIAPACPWTRDSVAAAYEPFEGGFMVWRSDTREIYVLYEDGRYETHADTWREGESDNFIGERPPGGLFSPLRGFGKVWASQPGVREGLGWATAPEVGYTAVIETARENFGRYPATGIYLKLPDSRVVHLSGYLLYWETVP